MPSDLIGVKRSPLAAALARQVDGEVGFDRGTRAAFATDASNYRQPPLGVVFPRTIDALVSAVQICHEHGAPIVARGGGTSLAGQTCNEAVVIDCSRHLSKVEIDRERGVAQVEPGAIMASLRARANEAGWEFGPDPSTHDRCTLGGMLGNNSCGVHSVLSEFYGPGPRTSDHVELLDVITYDGERLRLGAELPASDRIKRTFVLFSEVEELVRERYPRIPRCSSGYNLIDLLPERGAHLGRALVGSESTLVMIAGAELRLIPAKPARVLVVIGFSDIFAAAAAAPRARERRPSGCEAFDDTLHDRMRHQHRDPHHALELLPEGRSWLFIEHAGETLAEARAEAHITAHRIRGTGVAIYSDPRAIAALADMREQALGVDAFATGRPDTHEGWEDASVHPDRLEPYLRAFRALLDEHQLHGSLYGHFGQGCVHTRIDFDLHSDAGIARYRRFTEDAARLVVSFGGSYSGEHGDGQSKAELHEIMFGPELVAAFGELKQIWDPDGGMNPGKLVRPNPRTANLRLRDFHPPQWSANGEHREPHGVGTLPASPVGRGRSPRGIDIQLHHGPDGFDFAHATVRCVGIGKCRKLDEGTMCPSYMVTRDERHSTRGRAHLLHEMLRGEIITDGWRSDEVREALDLCLACKACKHECPTGVDLASYKAEFMTHHWEGRLRPRAQYAFGWLPRWLTIMRPLAPLVNWLGKTAPFSSIAKWLAGISPERELPKLARRSFRRSFRAAPADPRAPRVILWPDTFNDAFYPEILHASVRALEQLGFAVDIPRRRLCCARPMIEYGMLEPARRRWRRTLHELGDEIDRGTLVVGVEPSCTTTFRDELLALFPDDDRAKRLSEQTVTIAELIDRYALPVPRATEAGEHALYHRHCHQHAVLSPETEARILRASGLDLEVLDSGCCGMAGAFGFQRETYEHSVALAERVLLPAMRAHPDALVIADGFSCREQVRQLTGIRPLHTAEILAAARPDTRVTRPDASPAQISPPLP